MSYKCVTQRTWHAATNFSDSPSVWITNWNPDMSCIDNESLQTYMEHLSVFNFPFIAMRTILIENFRNMIIEQVRQKKINVHHKARNTRSLHLHRYRNENLRSLRYTEQERSMCFYTFRVSHPLFVFTCSVFLLLFLTPFIADKASIVNIVWRAF
jgi:hypothetical protein